LADVIFDEDFVSSLGARSVRDLAISSITSAARKRDLPSVREASIDLGSTRRKPLRARAAPYSRARDHEIAKHRGAKAASQRSAPAIGLNT
jgi:hypothetical protein